MSSDAYPYPVAVSQLGERDSREAQNTRAIRWLLGQPGDRIAVVTPRRTFQGESLKRLVDLQETTHLTWRGLFASSLAGHRVLHAWPDREHLNELWGVEANALVVVEWGEVETASWIEDANPSRLLPNATVPPSTEAPGLPALAPLPNGVDEILESIAAWAAGYDAGLKWNEEDKLKADMMNRPERWAPVTVEQVRAKCRELRMRAKDVETIVGLVERRKQGHRFRVRTYRDFHFD